MLLSYGSPMMWNVMSTPHSLRNLCQEERRKDQTSPHRQVGSTVAAKRLLRWRTNVYLKGQYVTFYSVFMDDLTQTLERIPKFGKKLKELIDIEEGIETEGAVRYSQALPVSEQVILVTSLNEWLQ